MWLFLPTVTQLWQIVPHSYSWADSYTQLFVQKPSIAGATHPSPLSSVEFRTSLTDSHVLYFMSSNYMFLGLPSFLVYSSFPLFLRDAVVTGDTTTPCSRFSILCKTSFWRLAMTVCDCLHHNHILNSRMENAVRTYLNVATCLISGMSGHHY